MSVPNRLDRNKPGDRMLGVQGMSDLTHAERTVLSVIAWHDGEAGAWPSLERIAAIAVMSRARASAIVGELERKGRLERRKGQRTNLYVIEYGGDPAVTETATAQSRSAVTEIGTAERGAPPSLPSRNPKSCRHGNRDTNKKEPVELATKECQGCGVRLPAGCFDCLACGLSHVRMVRCTGCGAALTAEAPWCSICGSDVLVADDMETT